MQAFSIFSDLLLSFFDSGRVNRSAFWRNGILPFYLIAAGIPTEGLILVLQVVLTQGKHMLNLSLCNYSAAMPQICCLFSASQQYFPNQILPENKNSFEW